MILQFRVACRRVDCSVAMQCFRRQHRDPFPEAPAGSDPPHLVFFWLLRYGQAKWSELFLPHFSIFIFSTRSSSFAADPCLMTYAWSHSTITGALSSDHLPICADYDVAEFPGLGLGLNRIWRVERVWERFFSVSCDNQSAERDSCVC